MDSLYLGRIPFARALREQERVVRCGGGQVLGFESEPVVTLGKRGEAEDLCRPASELEALGFGVLRLDRGGQATIHNPGQLVIFPVLALDGAGARAWVQTLADATAACLRAWNVESRWDEAHPGLYTERGKIASVGVRLCRGVSTHGVAINVCNALEDFAHIRVCGVSAAPVAQIGAPATPELVFKTWMENFKRLWPLTRSAFSPNLGANPKGAPSSVG